MPSSPVVTKHLAHLDGWRALAALWVLVNHCWWTVNIPRAHPAVGIYQMFNYGHLAVDLFIVISGFCLMLPVINDGGNLRGGALEFIKRRAWRILPPYYFAVLFCLFLNFLFIHQKTGTLWDFALTTDLKSIVTHFLLIHDAFGEAYRQGINYVFWSIAVEWRLYFFFPLLVLGWRYLGPLKTLLVALAVSWVLYRLCLRTLDATLTINYLGLFASGMLAAAVAFPTTPSLERLRKLPWGWITLIILAISVTLYYFKVRTEIRDYGFGFLCSALLIVTTIDREAWHHRLLGSRPLAFLGTFAYSIYLVHSPLLQLLYQYPYAPIQQHFFWMRGVLFPEHAGRHRGLLPLFPRLRAAFFEETKIRANCNYSGPRGSHGTWANQLEPGGKLAVIR